MQVPTEDRFLMTESELKNKIAVLLGGRAAEELIYEEASTGAHDDLTKATDIARSMIKTFGMSPKLGQISFERDRRTMLVQAPEPVARHHDYSEETAREIDVEVRRIIDEQIERVVQLLEDRKPVLMRAARTLIAKETITGAELRAIAVASGNDATEDDATDGHASSASDAWLGP
jgi:cell division protease FtsH